MSKMHSQTPAQGFINVDYPDPHRVRRLAILKNRPEVASLYGHEPRTGFFIIFLFLLQMVTLYYAIRAPWLAYCLMLYFVGATINHMFYFLIHECVHGVAAERKWVNSALGMLANLTIGIPIAEAFKKYHLDHHRYLGDRLDTDLPLPQEAAWCTTRLKKILWLLQESWVV